MEGTNVRLEYPEDVIGPDPDKPLPHNIEAEQAVLGQLAISREALPLVTGIITPEHFTRLENRRLYRLILGAYDDGAESIDEHMMEVQLAKIGFTEYPGEVAYYWSVINSQDSPDKTQAALDYVLRALADNQGHMRRQEILVLAKLERISESSLDAGVARAVEEGSVTKVRDGKHVVYRLADETFVLETLLI